MLKGLVRQVVPGALLRARRDEFRKETHINRAIRAIGAQTYVEIGVESGRCFRQIAAPNKIAVDPAPWECCEELADGGRLFRTTSDAFFAAHAARLFATERIDVALVDGLHEFPQAARDILNLEQFMAPNGVMFIHDCNPPTRTFTESRESDWTGDVWKCAYFLTNYRPDLRFFTLDCDWGVGVLTGFGGHAKPATASADTLENCGRLDYSVLERQRKRILQLRSPYYSFVFFALMHARRRKHAASS